MTIARVLRASGAVSLAFGAGLLVLPALLLGMYGLRADAVTELVARLLGGQLLGFGVLDWFAASAEPAAQRRVNVAGGVAEGASLAGVLVAIGGAGGNALLWSVPTIFGLFVIARIFAASRS